MYPGRTREQKEELAHRILQATQEVCKLDNIHATVVVIEDVEREDWPKSVVPEIEAKRDRVYGADL
jgi:phenylpyruvate tautomerase PptA (4-oxalocrotonate tautomerase family)